jgi:hypothetical protein
MNLFDKINAICYNPIVNHDDKNLIYYLNRYKHNLVVLPQQNYQYDRIYIPEMSIPYENLVFTNHMQVHFKYILTFNERQFILSHSCFCGKMDKNFKPEFPEDQVGKLKLFKDDKEMKFIIVPETELDIETLKTGKHAKEYILRGKWLICSLMKLKEIDDEEIANEEEGTDKDMVYSKDESVENFILK